jgi:hypothetical protein
MSDRRVFRVRLVNVRLKSHWRPRVTDHAMARYIERVFGIQVTTDHFKEARKALVGKAVETAILHGAGAVALGDGVKVILEGRSVVTVLGPEMRPKNDTKKILRDLAKLNELYPIGGGK